MAFVLLQRPLLVNRSDHRSLPMTSLRRKQHRGIYLLLSHQNKHFGSLVGHAVGQDDPSAYETELEILERRREELEYLLDTWTKESLYNKRDVQNENKWLNRLQDVIKFYYKEGRTPKEGRKGNEHSLALWISNQRRAKRCLDEGKPRRNKMTTERIDILELMAWWVWDAHEAAWNSNFAELEKYVEKYGEIPPISHPTLGSWVETQRQAWNAWQAHQNGETDKYTSVNAIMDEERVAKLQSLMPWSWEPFEDAWEANYQELAKYVRQHKKIPAVSHPVLGKWVHNQRIAYQAWRARSDGETDKYSSVTHYMDEERATKLEAVPHWKWDMRPAATE